MDGTAVLTEDCRRRMSGCQKFCPVMATGKTGAGKSTSLSQLVHPVYDHYDDPDGVFAAGHGMEPVTDVDFMAFGPIPLNEWLSIHRPFECEDDEVMQLLAPQEGDEDISIFLIDTRGTGAARDICRQWDGSIIDVDQATLVRQLEMATTAVTAGISVRFCVSQLRDQRDQLEMIAVGVRMIVFAQRGRPSYAVCAMKLNTYKNSTPPERRTRRGRRDGCGK
jgi:hypothetical protein